MVEESKFEAAGMPDEEIRLAEVLPDADVDTGKAIATSDEREAKDLPDISEQEEPTACLDEEASKDSQPVAGDAMQTLMTQINRSLSGIVDTEQRLLSEVKEMHKLYHNEFAKRLVSTQEELDQYHRIDRGRAFDDVLSAIARIYINNETLEDEVEDAKAKKSIRYLLLDLEELLGTYGVSLLHSAPGDKRNPRHCQVHERIATEDALKHDTVAVSYSSGFYIGNRTLIKEIVDIYVYGTKNVQSETEEQTVVDD